jgi:hypothetical protein
MALLALRHNHGDIVVLFMRAVFLDIRNNCLEQTLRSFFVVPPHCFGKPIFSELFTRIIERLRNSIGIESERVTREKLPLANAAIPLFE